MLWSIYTFPLASRLPIYQTVQNLWCINDGIVQPMVEQVLLQYLEYEGLVLQCGHSLKWFLK